MFHLLLTNDDGIDAPGLACLVDSVIFVLGDDCRLTVVAPDRCRSECGHSVTTGRALLVEEVRPNWFRVDGTPVDCVRAGVGVLSESVDAVISGVNAGANLGIDLLVSGTVAAAREAAVCGLPAIAVSHYRRPDIARTWDHVPGWLESTLRLFMDEVARFKAAKTMIEALELGQHQHTDGEQDQGPPFWNVNLPAIDPTTEHPPVAWCEVDPTPMTRITLREQSMIHFKSDFHGRPRKRGHDVQQCFDGSMTISRLSCPVKVV